MNDVDVLRDLLREDTLAATEQSSSGKATVVLAESEGPPYELSVTGVPYDTIAFKTDRFPPPTCVFNNRKGECKRADFVIVSSDEKERWIIYVEMKRGAGERDDIERQLRGARCVVAYCRAIVEEFWQSSGFLQDYDERFVIVREIRIDKRPTREGKRPVHDNPKHMLPLTAPNGILRFVNLLHGRQSARG